MIAFFHGRLGMLRRLHADSASAITKIPLHGATTPLSFVEKYFQSLTAVPSTTRAEMVAVAELVLCL